jgi:hypothetical protein
MIATVLGLAATLGVTACGTTTSTSNNFTGDSHDVAQTISDLQTNAQNHDGAKICSDDLASTLVAKLNASGTPCATVIKNQLNEVDTFSLSVPTAPAINTTTVPPTATARVKSTSAGKDHFDTVTLVKEGSSWKISGIGG